MKVLMVIVDGMSDRGNGDTTPLKSAHTPNLDFLAERGIAGIMDTIRPGIRPGSDTAHFSILGYDPFEYYTGRGPIEAAGAGIDVKPGDIAFRVNFGTVEGDGSIFEKIVVDRRAGRIQDKEELVRAVNENVKLDGVEFILANASGHRAALVFRGEGLSDRITDSDPKKEGGAVKRVEPLDSSAEFTARMVNEFIEKSHEVLENHPLNAERAEAGLPKANALLLRGVGKAVHVPKFEERYGLKAAFVAGTTLIKGIGRLIGADVIKNSKFTGSRDTDLNLKVETALKTLETHDFVLLHIKAPDEFGHDGDFEGKKEFIEKVDQAIAPLKDLDFSRVCLTVLSDHSTPVSVRDHSADPVPVMIVQEGVRRDEVKAFNEFEVYKGGLCRIRGEDLMNIILDLIGKAKKFGA
ncbi:2,3-bisphosphoglycerate-independent phosphoglycerate mutase [Geoglobus acetivorans]|uniref:2,3-bisphosphoglycerate-independent phosphoglycerate mutase n=1 Tax=Geoglobus acetivorans TaxID=565033 RepID=A0ABZ3H3L4_GEOAI|nr:2,3-bisphosphoglycerate-independent phosphoglycerate mutase [Geoglobus acetivorans]